MKPLKFIVLALAMSLFSLSLEASPWLKYKMRRHFNRIEQDCQHQNWLPACKDPYRFYHNWDRRPQSRHVLPPLPKILKRHKSR